MLSSGNLLQILGGTEGIEAATLLAFDLTGLEATLSGSSNVQQVYISLFGQSSLALVATLLSVVVESSGEEPEGEGQVAATSLTGAALPNQPGDYVKTRRRVRMKRMRPGMSRLNRTRATRPKKPFRHCPGSSRGWRKVLNGSGSMLKMVPSAPTPDKVSTLGRSRRLMLCWPVGRPSW